MNYLNKKINTYNYNYAKENIEIIVTSILAFSIPFFIGHPQIIVGVIINFLLIKSAYNYSFKKSLPVIILPSFAVYFKGILFGSLTPMLLYLTPFIIIGNLSLVLLSKQYFKKYKDINLSKVSQNSIYGIIIKTLIIGFGTLILYLTNVVPVFFIKTMALLQIVTATIALILFVSNLKIFELIKSRKI